MPDTERTRAFVTDLFRRVNEEGWAPFFEALSDDLVWEVTGDSPISRTYHGKDDYLRGCVARLGERLARWPQGTVEQLLVDGDTATVLLRGERGLGHNGTDYTLRYCWVMHIAGERIDRVTGFYEADKVNELFAATAG